MKYFVKDIKEYGIRYAILMKLWLLLDNINFRTKALRKLTKLQDKIEIILDKYDNHMQHQEPLEFESNCINHWSCDCCPNRCLCNEYSY